MNDILRWYVFCWEKTRQLKRATTKALLPQMIPRSPSLARKKHIAPKKPTNFSYEGYMFPMPTDFTVFSLSFPHFFESNIHQEKKTWNSKLNGKYMEICSSCTQGSIIFDDVNLSLKDMPYIVLWLPGFCRGDKSHKNVKCLGKNRNFLGKLRMMLLRCYL